MSAVIIPFLAMADHPNRIYELRRALSISQEDLGNMVGCSKMHISGLERGKRELSLSWMRRIADALGVLPADLLSAEDNPLRLKADERTLITRYRNADESARENIQRVTEALSPFHPQSREVA